MSGNWTEVGHVDVLYENSVAGREPHVRALIAAAERILINRVPNLASRVESGDVDVALVQQTVAQAVIRYMRNPGGLTQRSVTEGPFTGSESYAAAAAAQAGTGISFTREELDDLREVSALPDGFGVARQSIPAWRIP